MNTYKSPLCSCVLCKKELTPGRLLRHFSKCINRNNCLCCNKLTMNVKFCSKNCSAKFNNTQRTPRTSESRLKTSRTLKNNANTKRAKSNKIEIVGLFSKLFMCSCKHCGTKFITRKKSKYCTSHRDLYSHSNRGSYKFTFNVYDYPDLFDLSELKIKGWFAPGGKSGRWNIDGLSRDHRISVNEAIINNYDPYYISHPLNCELMSQRDNTKKKTKSSITYEELKSIVDIYESNDICSASRIRTSPLRISG